MNKLKESADNRLNFPQVDSDLEVWLIFEGEEYEVNQFNIGFNQSVDHKGQPQSEVRGGRMMLTLTQAVPENVYQWAMTSCLRDGAIEFRSKTTSSPLKVEFTNAYCVGFNRIIAGKGGLSTALTLSPEDVTINGISLYNNWT